MNALRNYVKREDNFSSWRIVEEKDLGSYKDFKIEIHSQKWKDILWKHELDLILPKEIKHGFILLFITGGRSGLEENTCKLTSASLGIPCAVLFNVPNQPLFNGLYEDAIIAYTFMKFIETRDEEWPLLLPMVKSAKVAIDALEEFISKIFEKPRGFIVTGASKRGWTTWLLAAVEERVKGIAPIVFDNLNFVEQMKRQVKYYGKYSEQISDYTKLGLMDILETEVGKKLLEIVDPFSYVDSIQIPKLIINGTNDRYWTLDSANVYFDSLKGKKYLLYVPNSGHGLEDRRRVINSISAFVSSIVLKLELPEVSVEKKENSSLLFEYSSNVEPIYVDSWITTSKSLDFRESRWFSFPLVKENEKYKFSINKQKDYVATFGEFGFVLLDKQPFTLSTKISIVPPL